jgi:hypothetical protein
VSISTYWDEPGMKMSSAHSGLHESICVKDFWREGLFGVKKARINDLG